MSLRNSSGEENDGAAEEQSSASPGVVEDAKTPGLEPVDAAEPSAAAAKDAKKEPSFEDVVKTAAELDADGKPSIPAKDGSKAKADPPEELKTEAKAEDDKDLPFHNHPRWKEVLGERDTLKARVSKLEPEVEQFSKITSFMDQHKLLPEEVSQGFVLMAMMKAGDPKALAELDRYREMVARAVGEVLPDDLKIRVESNTLSEDDAREMSRMRASGARARADADTARAHSQESETRRTQDQLAGECAMATEAWAVRTKTVDPDFAHKEPVIERYVRAMLFDGRPKNSAEAVKLVEKAYAEVNKHFGAARSAKAPNKPLSSANLSTGAKPVPRTLAEVVAQAAEAA